MLQAYTQAAASLNLLRAFSQGGYADINRVHSWTLDSTSGQPGYEQYQKLANRISDALDFMRAAGVDAGNADTLHRVDFYTSHEALLLEYEEALCRIDSTTGVPVAGSGTCCGSATARGSPTARMWSSCAACRTRSG